jgi:hypothetical protein
MNEKPVKVPMDFDEALRRIAKTPKGVVVPEVEKSPPKSAKKPAKVKTAPDPKKGRGKVD